MLVAFSKLSIIRCEL